MAQYQFGIRATVEKYQIRIDPENPEPKNLQVARGIKELIRNVVVVGEEYLPGERSLARHLEVDRDVVHRAYKKLEGEGYFKFKNHLGHCLIKNPSKLVLDEKS